MQDDLTVPEWQTVCGAIIDLWSKLQCCIYNMVHKSHSHAPAHEQLSHNKL